MTRWQKKPRDRELIDALDAFDGISFEGSIWRVVPRGKNPCTGHPSGGRWDPGTFDVIYSSLEPDGALAEIEFRISNQPARPSKVTFVLHGITVTAKKTLELVEKKVLAKLGIDLANFSGSDYQRTREIGDVAYFLDYDGMLVPNARWRCNNLVLFTEQLAPGDLRIQSSKPIDFDEWRVKKKGRKRSRDFEPG